MNLPKFVLSGVRRVLPALLLGSVAVSLSAWAGPKQVPFKARITAQEVILPYDPNGLCPDTGVVGTTTGKGTASHMGAVRLEATDCPIFVVYQGIPIPIGFTSGKLTLTAANGDELYAKYSGHLALIGAGVFSIVNGTYTVNNDDDDIPGTGRFSNAKGSGVLQGTITLVSDTEANAQYEVKGTLSY